MSDDESAVAIREIVGLAGYAGSDGQRRMIALADEFKAMCDQRAKTGKPWIVNIGPGRHLTIEAWQYLGQRAGIMVQTVPELTVEIRNPVTGDFEGVRAVAEAIRLDTGAVVTRAVQVCYADEVLKRKDGTVYRRWNDEEGKPNRHAIMGMAQTRAHSRTHASAIRFVAEMAGMDGTPAEEMDGVTPSAQDKPPVKPPRRKPAAKPAPAPEAEDNEAVVGKIAQVSQKSGEKQDGTSWTRWGVKIDVEWYGTFDPKVGDVAEAAKAADSTVRLDWEQDGAHKSITSLGMVADNYTL